MKKLFFLLAGTALLASQTSKAGKYFDYTQDDQGRRGIHFKKSGKKFQMAASNLIQFSRSHEINFISFQENVTPNQRGQVCN